MNTRITRPKREGKKVYVLVFDGKQGKYKKNGKGHHVLNPIEKIECISIVDARAVLLKYLEPAKIRSYDRCREIINNDGYLSVIILNGIYSLG